MITNFPIGNNPIEFSKTQIGIIYPIEKVFSAEILFGEEIFLQENKILYLILKSYRSYVQILSKFKSL